MAEIDLYKLSEQITEVLVKSQFAFWIDKNPVTATQINAQNERAIKYYLGELEREDKESVEDFLKRQMQSDVFSRRVKYQVAIICLLTQKLTQ